MLVDSGRSDLLSVIVGLLGVDTYYMGLYSNNHTMFEADTYAVLTEVAVAGYSRQLLASPGAPTGPIGGVWDSIFANVTFGNSSGAAQTVYGYFFIGVSRGIFYGGDLFAGGPLSIPAGGSLIFSPSWNDTTN